MHGGKLYHLALQLLLKLKTHKTQQITLLVQPVLLIRILLLVVPLVVHHHHHQVHHPPVVLLAEEIVGVPHQEVQTVVVLLVVQMVVVVAEVRMVVVHQVVQEAAQAAQVVLAVVGDLRERLVLVVHQVDRHNVEQAEQVVLEDQEVTHVSYTHVTLPTNREGEMTEDTEA